MADLTGRVDKTYVSSISFLDQREIMDQVFDQTSEDATILDILEMTGRESITAQPTFHSFTNQYLFRKGNIATVDGTIDGQSADEDIKITLTNDYEMPVVGEVALFENGEYAWVESVTDASKIFVARVTASGQIINPSGTAIDNTQNVVFFTGAFGEGSSDPVGRKPDFVRSANTIQIFKEAVKITDLQKVSTIEVKYNGKPYVFFKAQNDALIRHRMKIAYGLLFGKQLKFTDNDSYDVYMTQGLRNYIKSGDGVVLTTGGTSVALSSSAVTKAKLRTMSRTLDKERAPAEYWLWGGGDFCADLEDLVLTLDGVKAGGIQYNSFGRSNPKQRAIDLGVDSLRLYGRTLHVKKLEAYDHPEVFGALTALDLAGEAYMIPTNKIKADKSGNMKDRISVRYMSGDGTNLRHMESITGKLAPNPTDDEAVLRVGYESIMGLEAIGLKHFGIYTP